MIQLTPSDQQTHQFLQNNYKKFNHKTLKIMSSFDPHQLRQQIKNKYHLYDLKKQYSYDELLFILDQECELNKCDRDVARELFEQSMTPTGKVCLDQVIFRYVENLQTSGLCLVREERARQTITQKLGNLKGSAKSYAHIKIIQITSHARHSSTPALTYKIQPSDIPPVTVVNSLNPILNHEFTLQLETPSFSIVFFESGVKISEWVWPDAPDAVYQGEYYRNVMGQNVSFQIKINYKPKNSNPERKGLEENLRVTNQKVHREGQALTRLQEFQPFVMKKPKKISHKSSHHGFVDKIFGCMPFLRNHVRNLYYALILLIALECLASISWPMQFLDLTVAFGIIGTLYDQAESDLGMEMLVCILSFAILIVKSIWGFVVHDKNSLNWTVVLVLCIVGKLGCIFLAWVVSACKEEVPHQRQRAFYEGVDGKSVGEHGGYGEDEHYDIFQ